MKHYPHHMGDFDRATRHLTRLERSVYRDLIEMYYDTEQPLPLDQAIICRKILARSEDESTAVEQALNEFFIKTPTGWYHERCEEEIEKFRSNSSQKAVAGKASAAKRALKRQQALNGKPAPAPTPVESPLDERSATINQEPSTINQEPINTSSDEDLVLAGFDVIWDLYPMRPGRSKANALKAYKARIKEGEDSGKMRAGIAAYASYCQRMLTEPQFIKQPETFLGPGRHYLSDWSAPPGKPAATAAGRHGGFENRDYTAGANPDGTF